MRIPSGIILQKKIENSIVLELFMFGLLYYLKVGQRSLNELIET